MSHPDARHGLGTDFKGLSNKPKISQIGCDLDKISLQYCMELIRVYLDQIRSDRADLSFHWAMPRMPRIGVIPMRGRLHGPRIRMTPMRGIFT
jgi:hypothetical protein